VDAANKVVNAPSVPRAESETAAVQAETMIPTQPGATPAASRINVFPTTEQNQVVSLADAAGISKKQKASLPNGLEALSVASDAGGTIALDTKGALFLSEDGGKHWKPVRTQWTGHAVLVRTLPASPVFNSLKRAPSPRFELVTDSLQTWVSADGKTWTLHAMPGK
jgi:uncharacterized iron-regulated membrane protein